jgi:DNA polymerase I-like protein with 3'-5' exonuclease and polymerase domains
VTDRSDWRYMLSQEVVDILEQVDAGIPEERRVVIAAATLPVAVKKHPLVADGRSARDMINLLFASDVAALAVDSEYRFSSDPVLLKARNREWNDIRAMEPLLVSVSALVTEPGVNAILSYVLDVRVPEVVVALGELLEMPVPLVAHHLKAELFTFWQLGLDPEFDQVYDTFVAAAALNMGIFHLPKRSAGDGTHETIEAEMAVAAKRDGRLSLLGQCRNYDISHRFAHCKEAMQRSFINHAPGTTFAPGQISYSGADADVTLRLYVAQQPDLLRSGLHAHLMTIEFPFTVANARVEWEGVAIDWRKARQFSKLCDEAARCLATKLSAYGICNPRSSPQVLAALAAIPELRAPLALLSRGNKVSADKENLKILREYHELPGLIMKYREYASFATVEWLAGMLKGADKRVHPAHGQLRSDTGRNGCSAPNLVGISKKVRPLVVAPPGRALVELDYGQIEVAVAAAEHADLAMIAAYNSEDVYVTMAQRFYASKLSVEAQAMSAADFRTDKARAKLRDDMKVFVLAVLYNMTAPTIAAKFKLSEPDAEAARRNFLAEFPRVRDGLAKTAEYGLARGYAYVRTGLRRRASQYERSWSRTRNAMLNTPIQGGAAIVFKKAVVALDRHFRHTTTKIILPIHDAVLIECDESDLAAVTLEAKAIMIAAMRATYPRIRPKVDANDVAPWCWNKDGAATSLDDYMAEADAALGGKDHARLGLAEPPTTGSL